MPIVLNTNASATEATFNLNQANDNLRRSIARLSSVVGSLNQQTMLAAWPLLINCAQVSVAQKLR